MLTPESALRKDRTTANYARLEHRHFAMIAAILHDLNTDEQTVAAWADRLAPSNPRFDRSRFFAAALRDA